MWLSTTIYTPLIIAHCHYLLTTSSLLEYWRLPFHYPLCFPFLIFSAIQDSPLALSYQISYHCFGICPSQASKAYWRLCTNTQRCNNSTMNCRKCQMLFRRSKHKLLMRVCYIWVNYISLLHLLIRTFWEHAGTIGNTWIYSNHQGLAKTNGYWKLEKQARNLLFWRNFWKTVQKLFSFCTLLFCKVNKFRGLQIHDSIGLWAYRLMRL